MKHQIKKLSTNLKTIHNKIWEEFSVYYFIRHYFLKHIFFLYHLN